MLVAEDYESTFQVREMLLALVALIQEHARATATTADPLREVGPVCAAACGNHAMEGFTHARAHPPRRCLAQRLSLIGPRLAASPQAFSHLDDILALLNAYMPNGMLMIANQSFARNTRRDLEGQLQRT